MNELIKINTSNPDRPTVLGRDLHEALEVKTAYKDWFPRMCEYGFTELKSIPKGSFVVMKTGRHPMQTKLRLFLDWGITFDEPYRIEERIDRPIAYAAREELLRAILEKYPPERFRKDRDVKRADSPQKASALHVPNGEVFR